MTSHDPRMTLLDIVSDALTKGVPQVQGRVDILRAEPLWDNDELPIILVDFANEYREIDAQAARYYRHTLELNIYAYVKGSERNNRKRIIDLFNAIEAVMREWQSIIVGDVVPGCPMPERDDYIVDEIAAGDSVTWFKSPNTNMSHAAVCIEYKAVFQSDGNAAGVAAPGIPDRNVLGDLDVATSEMAPLQSMGITIESETTLPK